MRKRMNVVRWLAFSAVLAVAMPVWANQQSAGTDFWLAFQQNYSTTPTLQYFISGDVATSGSVEIAGLGFSQAFTVTPGAVTTIDIPANAAAPGADQVSDYGVRVLANDPVTVYGLNLVSASSDAYLSYPKSVLGTEHVVGSYVGLNGNPSQLTVVGTVDGTMVTVTPSVAAGSGRAAGGAYTVTVNEGQTYNLQATGTGDLTGTIVESDHPVAVFGGVKIANVTTSDGAADFITQQIPPVSAWGKSYATVPLQKPNMGAGDVFRILSAVDGTQVEIGADTITLDRGQFEERILVESTEIQADEPILVIQYARGLSAAGDGDPFMMVLPSLEQYLPRYTVGTAGTQFTSNYVNIVAPAAVINDVMLNGSPVDVGEFSAIGDTGFYGATVGISAGTYTLEAAQPIGASVYGYTGYDSYGYPAGASYAPIALLEEVVIDTEGETVASGEEYCSSVVALDSNGEPLEGIRIDVVVAGVNNFEESIFTDATGEALFCYLSEEDGVDTVTMTSGGTSDSKEVTWSSGPEDGFTALVATEEADAQQCPAGGVVLMAGLDMDRSGVLEAGEVDASLTRVICNGVDGQDGQNGADGQDGQDGQDGFTALFDVEIVAARGNCVQGGIQISMGLDNGTGDGSVADNGLLETGEVLYTEVICHGVDGQNGMDGQDGADGQDGQDGADGFASLVVVDDQIAESCDWAGNGGYRILSGLDNGAGESVAYDGVLSEEEVLSETVICHGADGADGQNGADGQDGADGFNSLVVTDGEVGDACDSYGNGGQRIRTGLDNGAGDAVAHDGELSDDEVQSTTFVCHGADGFSVMVDISDEPEGENCPAGGQRVDVGYDFDRSEELEAEEIEATSYICDGVRGNNGVEGIDGEDGEDGQDGENGVSSLVNLRSIEAGAEGCAAGGVAIETGLDANENGTLDEDEVSTSMVVCDGQPVEYALGGGQAAGGGCSSTGSDAPSQSLLLLFVVGLVAGARRKLKAVKA